MNNNSKKPDNASPLNNSPAVKTSLTRSIANHTFIHIACLVFLILALYAHTLNAPFLWDEGKFIVNNPIIKDLHYFSNPSDAKSFELYGALINRYVGYLTFALNYRMHGLSVTGYHVVNIAIHISNSILVYFFVLLTFKTPFFSRLTTRDDLSAPPLVALFSALLFAVHPLQTEAVTYVFQRFACLVAFFYLLSLAAYIKSRLSEGRRQRVFYYGISFISAVLAMKTKENAFTLPLVIVLYEFCFFTGSTRKRLLYLTPFLLTMLIIPLSLMSLTGSHRLDPGAYGAREFSRTDYFFTQFRVIITYLRLLVFPVNQNIDYDYPLFKSFLDPQVLSSFVFLALLFGLGIYLLQRAKGMEKEVENKAQEDRHSIHYAPYALRLMGFGILWFFITLSVESSIIPISMIIDEYRVYLPSIGLIISVVSGLFLLKETLPSRFTPRLARFARSDHPPFTIHYSRVLFVLLAVVIVVLSVATNRRNEVWTDKIRLWEDTVRKSPGKAAVHLGLGDNYQDTNMLDKAVEQYLIAIKLAPDAGARAHLGLGYYYQSRKMPDKAVEQYLLAIKLEPDHAGAHNNLGSVYQYLKMTDKAMEQYLLAIKLKPDFAQAHYNLGLLYQDLNMPDKAMEQYLTTITLMPDLGQAHDSLGTVYQIMNMPDKAVEQYMMAVKLMPGYANAHFNLGLAYYKMGQMENAGRELMTGLNINPDNQRARQLLEAIRR